MRYEHHIFICTNQKAPGKACCGEQTGLALVDRFREVIREKGLVGKVRAQRSGCLDNCQNGPSVVIYPLGTYYAKVQLSDVNRIVEAHLIQGEVLKELEWTFEDQKE